MLNTWVDIIRAGKTLYRPNDIVEASGIYDVVHDSNHEQKHQITCVKGERFPPCHGCSHGVRFRLSQRALHLSEHSLFRRDK